MFNSVAALLCHKNRRVSLRSEPRGAVAWELAPRSTAIGSGLTQLIIR